MFPQSRLPTADDFSGEYVLLPRSAAPPGRLPLQSECFQPPALPGGAPWRGRVLIVQGDGRLRLVRSFDRYITGPVPPPAPEETASGAAADAPILEGVYRETWPKKKEEPVRYQLHFDAASSHLVGTRNDEPIELAPFEWLAPKGPCGPPPA